MKSEVKAALFSIRHVTKIKTSTSQTAQFIYTSTFAIDTIHNSNIVLKTKMVKHVDYIGRASASRRSSKEEEE